MRSHVIITDYKAFVNIDARSCSCYNRGMRILLIVGALCLSGWGHVFAQDAVTVPFQFTGNHIFVSISINGKGPFPAAFDTGGLYLIAPELSKKLHLAPLGMLQVGGFGERIIPAEWAQADSVQIGSLTLTRPKFAVVDMGELPIKSIVGYELLKEFVVRVDYDARLLTLTRPDKFVYRGTGVVLPLHLHGHIPVVEGTADGVKGLFALDTGSGSALDLFGPFIQAHDLRRKYAAGFTQETGIGLGGATRAQFVHVGSLTLGAAVVRGVETQLTADHGGVSSDTEVAGNIGETVLEQFNLTFDYKHARVILEKSKGYGKAEDGHGGLGLEPQGRAWRVTSVTPAGAAAQAGIRGGDRVLQIEGKDASQASLFALWDVFHRPIGTKVWLLLRKGQQKQLVAITLGKVP